MATTRLIPLHINKGKTIAQTIKDRTNYVENPDKTINGELVTGYECDPRTADVEFLLLKKQYASITGRSQGDKDVIAYHTRQAFRPGEITADEANKIGYELALAFTKGKHQFIVATHVDKEHIHNHIVFNSTSLDCKRKFRNFWGSSFALRRISDRICIENGLSIIDNPKPSKGHYGTWLGEKKPVSWREKLKQNIDLILDEKPADLDVFIHEMKAKGYEVKQGKHLSFRASEQKKFIRLRSLGEDYSDNAIIERIEGKRIVTPAHKPTNIFVAEANIMREPLKVNLLIDVQNSIKAKNSPGYEQWAKIFNLKQAAQTLIYLQENNLTEYKILEEKTAQVTKVFNDLSSQIKEKETRLNEISTLQKHISNYSRTREIYIEYRKAGYNKKFYAEHESEIILHQSVKKAFDALGVKNLPSIKILQTEYATLLAEKKKLYQSYKQAKENLKELSTVKVNTDRLLSYSDSQRGQGKER